MDVVGLVDRESVGRSMVDRGVVDRDVLDRGVLDRGMVDRDMLDRGSVGWVLVDRGGVDRLMVMVGTRVLWGSGASLVRPRVVWEPGGVGQVLQVRPPSD